MRQINLLSLLFILLTSLVVGQEPAEPDDVAPAVPAFPSNSVPLVIGPSDTESSNIILATDNPAEEDTAIQLINDLRQQIGGLNCLVTNEILRQSSYDHSKDMHDRNYFSNNTPENVTPGQRASTAGYGSSTVGQSISAGNGGIRNTAIEAVANWRGNRSNYHNLLIPNYQEIAVGWYSGTLNFEDYWTVMLGAGAGVSGVACGGNPAPITHIPTVQSVTNRNLALPTYNWTRQITTTTGRVPATFFDVEVYDTSNNRVLRVPTSTKGPAYAADNICTDTVCSIQPPASAYENSVGLEAGKSYTVWVRAWSQTGGYVWSDKTGTPFSIDTSITPNPTSTSVGNPNPTPILNQPTGTVNAPDGAVSLIWTGIDTATAYEIYLARQDTPSTPTLYTVFDAERYCTGLSCAVQNFPQLNSAYQIWNGTYIVYLRAWQNTTPLSNWSQEHTFTLQATPPAPPTIGALSALTDTVTSKPTYNWTLDGTAVNAYWFDLYVAPTNSLANYVVYERVSRTAACDSPTGTTCSYTPKNGWLFNVPHNVYISSFGPGGKSQGGVNNSGWSEASGLSLSFNVPPVPAGFIARANQGRPTIEIGGTPDIAWYNVQLENTITQATVSVWVENPCGTGICILKPALDVPSGTYNLTLQAWGPAGYNNNSQVARSAARSITIPSSAPGSVTTLVASNQNSGTPTFSWVGAPNATWYFLHVLDGTNTIHGQFYLAADIGCENGGQCTVTPAKIILANGKSYNWAVYAYGPGGWNTGNNGPAINVNATAGAPTLLPIGTLTTPSPTFQWQHITDASYYQVSINVGEPIANPDLNTPIYSAWLLAQELGCYNSGNTCTLNVPDLYLGNGDFSWTVKAYTPVGLGTWTAPQRFKVQVPS